MTEPTDTGTTDVSTLDTVARLLSALASADDSLSDGTRDFLFGMVEGCERHVWTLEGQ